LVPNSLKIAPVVLCGLAGLFLFSFFHPSDTNNVCSLHHVVRALHELLLTLERLHRSEVEEQREFAATMLALVFYDYDFMQWLPRLTHAYNIKKQSRAYLCDLILTIHLVLKSVSSMKKSEAALIFTARRRRGGGKKGKVAAFLFDKCAWLLTHHIFDAQKAADGSTGTQETVNHGGDLSHLFDDDNGGDFNPDNEDGRPSGRAKEIEFDMPAYLMKFADAKTVLAYSEVQQQ
jgi:hypothetical protein